MRILAVIPNSCSSIRIMAGAIMAGAAIHSSDETAPAFPETLGKVNSGMRADATSKVKSEVRRLRAENGELTRQQSECRGAVAECQQQLRRILERLDRIDQSLHATDDEDPAP